MIAYHPDAVGFKERFGGIIANCKNPRAILAAAGREAGNQLKTHFRKKDRTNINSLAPDRREHLWLKISQSVQAPVVNVPVATVAVTHPVIAQKVFGGPIVAKRVKNLAIPVAPDAYGRSPRVFERETGLKLFVLKQEGVAAGSRGSVLLAAARGRGIEVEYVLKHRVNQIADGTALPPQEQFAESILQRALTVQQRQLQGEN